MDRESSLDSTTSSSGIGVPYQESGPPADSIFRGREDTLLTALNPGSVSVFSGPSESDSTFPAETRQPKEQTCTVVPPTAEGGGSHYDFTVPASSRTEERADPEVLSKICDRLAKLETDHDKVKDKCTRMQTEINQLKTDVKNKDEEIQKKDSEISKLKLELKEAGTQRAELEKKLADQREAYQKQLQHEHEQQKTKEKQLKNKIGALERQKSQITEERSLLIRKMAQDADVKEKLQVIESKIDSCVESHVQTDTGDDSHDGVTFTFSRHTEH